MRQVAVITGGAGGLGRALCEALITQGWYVVLIDLPTAALDSLASEHVGTYGCDLTDAAATQYMCAQICCAYPEIDLVIYNAGVTQVSTFAESDLDAHKRVMEVNYLSVIHTAKYLLYAVRAAKGTHLAISSVAGFAPLHKRTAYSASKHAIEGFMKSLRSEEKIHGVRVLIAAPSFVATNLDKKEQKPGSLLQPGSFRDGLDYMTPEKAAETILAGYHRRRERITVGRIATLSWYLNRLSPRLFAWQMEKKIRK